MKIPDADSWDQNGVAFRRMHWCRKDTAFVMTSKKQLHPISMRGKSKVNIRINNGMTMNGNAGLLTT